jgi:hypothetical protein
MIPALSTAGPSAPEVKLLTGVKTEDLKSSPESDKCCVPLQDTATITNNSESIRKGCFIKIDLFYSVSII